MNTHPRRAAVLMTVLIAVALLLCVLHDLGHPQPAPTTRAIILRWDCTGTCTTATTITAYSSPDPTLAGCTGTFTAGPTVAAPASSMTVTSSTTTNTCWKVTAKTGTAGDESALSNAARWPTALQGGIPIRLLWDPPSGGTSPAQYRVSKQVGCTGSFVSQSIVNAPTTSYLVLPPNFATDCWRVSALASDGSEGPQTASFQIPASIMGGSSPFIIRMPR